MARLSAYASIVVFSIGLLSATASAAPAVGEPEPALVVDELDGTSFDLSGERGHVVVINIWATWCGPCRDEMPLLNDFYKRFHPQGVDLLGLSVDDKHDESAVRAAMKAFQYPAALSKSAKQNGFGSARVVPITYIFDKQGILRAKLWPGGTPVTAKNLEQVVQPLLAAPHAPDR